VRFEPTNSTIVPTARSSGHPQQGKEGAPLSAHVAMGWAKRLKRVFGIETETCGRAAGKPRSDLDMIVATVAETNDCVIVTDNEKHFSGLEVLNPLRTPR
jgi:hypothetical protein